MDLQNIKESIVTNVYHIDTLKNVALHKHPKHDEIFYCIKGEGFGVLEGSEVELAVGKAFIVSAGEMHALRTNSDLYVTSFLVPVI
jgi:quercetin dioxygenase-like cupin family protein